MYCVLESQLESFRQSFEIDDMNDDLGNVSLPPSRKRKLDDSNLNDQLSSIISDIREIKDGVNNIFKINRKKNVPMGFINTFECFSCTICKECPANLPIIGCRSCNSIVGCESCVNTWYQGQDGLSKSCPRCRERRGYANTFQFKGMDDFITEMRRFLDDDSSGSNNSGHNDGSSGSNNSAYNDTIPINNDDSD